MMKVGLALGGGGARGFVHLGNWVADKITFIPNVVICCQILQFQYTICRQKTFNQLPSFRYVSRIALLFLEHAEHHVQATDIAATTGQYAAHKML